MEESVASIPTMTMKEKRKILLSYDDGGSFDRMLREAEAAAHGDQDLKLRLLTQRVMEGFCKKLAQREAKTTKKFDFVLGIYVPTRCRTGPCKRQQLPGQADDQDKMITISNSVKRPFDQTRTETLNSNYEQEPIRGSKNINNEPEKPIKKIKVNNNRNPVPHEIPEMPESFKNEIAKMGGTKVNLVLQKPLTDCDLRQNNNRFSMPKNQILTDFLEPNEEQRLEAKQSIKVRLIQPCLNKVTEVTLRKWQMGKTFSYNLTGNWHKLVAENKHNALEVDMTVQLYSFRVENNDNE